MTRQRLAFQRFTRLSKALCTGMIVASAAGAGASPAGALSGKLDRSFGSNGVVIGQQLPPLDMEVLPDGRIVVATERALYAYSANGSADLSFGTEGALAPFAPEGRTVTVDGIAVDRRGRIVIAGTARLLPAAANAGDATSYAAVERYLPSGELDTSFGSSGAVITDFGFPPPTRPAKIPSFAPFSPAIVVEASGVTVDDSDRIVLTGTRAATYTPNKLGYLFPIPEAFVARLDADGAQDPTFNQTGTRLLPGMQAVGRATHGRGGGLYLMATRAPASEYAESPSQQILGHLRNDGSPDPRFGDGGWKRLPVDTRFGSSFSPELVVDRRERLLIFGQQHAVLGGAHRALSAPLHGPSVERLRPDGSWDRGFGHNGAAIFASRSGGAEFAALAPTRGGGVLAVGTLRLRSGRGFASRLLLTRLTANGELDERFGRAGKVTTALRARAGTSGQAILVDTEGRALIGGGGIYDEDLTRFALGRYDLK